MPEGEGAPLGLILITVDTLRADFLSSYGHSRILTPSFDRLAAGGVLFRQALDEQRAVERGMRRRSPAGVCRSRDVRVLVRRHR